MREPTHDDFTEARKLLAFLLDAPPAAGYQHDHDRELSKYCYANLPVNIHPAPGVPQDLLDLHRRRDEAYWTETATLLTEYFELQAGDADVEMLFDGFVAWIEHTPGALKLYEEGQDMARAALVDWYLKLVR